jgi:hypothetical protein
MPKAISQERAKLKKIIVFGGSAGSIQALCTILSALPADLEAALLAVIHTGEEQNQLGQVFERCTDLKVIVVNEAVQLNPGCLFLSPPNKHLLVRDGCALSLNGPRENRQRPAVDVLFRSAARAHHSNVIGVIMSVPWTMDRRVHWQSKPGVEPSSFKILHWRNREACRPMPSVMPGQSIRFRLRRLRPCLKSWLQPRAAVNMSA